MRPAASHQSDQYGEPEAPAGQTSGAVQGSELSSPHHKLRETVSRMNSFHTSSRLIHPLAEESPQALELL